MMLGVRPIAEATAALPGPEREVLALLAESGLGYAAIGELLGVDAATVAAIAGRARLRLAGVEAPAACAARVPWLAAGVDGERLEDAGASHPAGCEDCAALQAAMREADAAYRAWASAPMPRGCATRRGGRCATTRIEPGARRGPEPV